LSASGWKKSDHEQVKMCEPAGSSRHFFALTGAKNVESLVRTTTDGSRP
jgi:hypothetical protein